MLIIIICWAIFMGLAFIFIPMFIVSVNATGLMRIFVNFFGGFIFGGIGASLGVFIKKQIEIAHTRTRKEFREVI